MSIPATMIYNGNARSARNFDVSELDATLRDAGFEPVSHATSSETDLDAILADAEGLVVAVGGDGTVREIALRMVGRGLPLAIAPAGTANNVAQTLGIRGSPREVLARLAEPRRRPFDVGEVRHPWGIDHFLEATGFGIFADVLYRYDPTKGKSVIRALNTLGQVLSGYQPRELHVRIDGEDASGPHLGLEILNTKATGPRLKLAPQADPGDGLLDVVRILPSDDVPLLAYAGRLLTEALDEMPNVESRRGRRIEIAWNGDPLHVDEHPRPVPDEDEEAPLPPEPAEARGPADCVEIEILPGALEVWLPAED